MLVGAGSIGPAVARRLEPFECEVELVASTPRPGAYGVEELPAPLPRTDVVVLTVPLVPPPEGWWTPAFLAALDVTDPEPPPPGRPLWTAPGLILSPPVGGNTTTFHPRALRLVREQLTRYAEGRELLNVVGPRDREPSASDTGMRP